MKTRWMVVTGFVAVSLLLFCCNDDELEKRNLSLVQNAVSVAIDAEATVVLEEAKGFCSKDVQIDADHSGFSGEGYANTVNEVGASLEWSVASTKNSTASLEWMFANGASAARPASLVVNNTTVGTVDFPSTGAWPTWSTAQQPTVNLVAGTNAIRLEATTSGGLPNINSMTIVGAGVSAGACDADADADADADTDADSDADTDADSDADTDADSDADTDADADTDTDTGPYTIQGELRLWHRVTLTFQGPYTSENAEPSPFYNYRLDVTFRQGDKEVVVPGFFAADGNAAETSATSGNKWRVHFVPDAVGEWTFEVSFRKGTKVAVDENPLAGVPTQPNGQTGSFTIIPTNKTGRDHRFHGTLEYVGEHYPQYKGSKEYFIMEGSQSPENFLAYGDFDGTRDLGGAGPGGDGLHHYEPHVKDWRAGDPTWKGGKGKGIIGAINYMASEHMNTLYAITFSSGGDGRDTWPWTGPKEYSRFDVSKLAQWEIVISHMDTKGMQLWVITQEEEEEQWLGKMTPQRKLYYRELIARFSHHHALMWDLDEEMDYHKFYADVNDIKDICEYFKKIDPYKHPITYVQWKAEFLEDRNMPGYERLLGYENFDGTGLQQNYYNTNRYTKKWVDASAKAGHKWLVGIIETNPNTVGVVPDSVDPKHDKERTEAVWGNLMAGGSGTVFFFGYKYPHSDISLEDFRSRDLFWDMLHYAHKFFMDNLPFWEMKHQDDLTPGKDDFVYAKEGDIYAVYLKKGGSPTLDLRNASGNFTVRWYDPRNGGELQEGNVKMVTGGSRQSLGNPPNESKKDWAVLVQREGFVITR